MNGGQETRPLYTVPRTLYHRVPETTTNMTLAANPRSLVFYLAYPGPGNLDGATRSLIDPGYVLQALDAVLEDDVFDALELTSFKSKKLQAKVAETLRGSKKRVAFHCEPVK